MGWKMHDKPTNIRRAALPFQYTTNCTTAALPLQYTTNCTTRCTAPPVHDQLQDGCTV